MWRSARAYNRRMSLSVAGREVVRRQGVRRGRRLEYLTVGWNSLEGFLAVGAGLAAAGFALLAQRRGGGLEWRHTESRNSLRGRGHV